METRINPIVEIKEYTDKKSDRRLFTITLPKSLLKEPQKKKSSKVIEKPIIPANSSLSSSESELALRERNESGLSREVDALKDDRVGRVISISKYDCNADALSSYDSGRSSAQSNDKIDTMTKIAPEPML